MVAHQAPLVPGILQARILDWVAISFSNAWKWKVKVKSFSRVWHSATPWTAAYRTSPSMGFSSQEYWSGGAIAFSVDIDKNSPPLYLRYVHFTVCKLYFHKAELFKTLKDDSLKVLHSICQQIWKAQHWPQERKSSLFIPIPNKGNAKECSNYCTAVFLSCASKIMLKILQAKL